MASLNRTPLAAINFDDGNGKHLRVYYQSPDGAIKESFYDSSVGWRGRPENTVGRGKLNTGISATTWANGTQIRIYFLDEDDKIVERMYTGGSSGWQDGGMTRKYQAAPYSRLGAVSFRKGEHIRVYYQDPNNKLREAVYRSTQGWTEGTDKLPVAFPGTAIAAATNPNDNGYLWVYSQAPNLKLQEYWNPNSHDWQQGGFKSDKVYPPGAAIAVALWSDPSKIRVLSVDQSNRLCATAWDGKWSPTHELAESTITLSDLAFISVAGGGQPPDALRLYFQNFGTQIAELLTQDGNNWSVSQNNVVGA